MWRGDVPRWDPHDPPQWEMAGAAPAAAGGAGWVALTPVVGAGANVLRSIAGAGVLAGVDFLKPRYAELLQYARQK